MFAGGTEVTYWAHIMSLVVFFAVFFYDFLYITGLANNV